MARSNGNKVRIRDMTDIATGMIKYFIVVGKQLEKRKLHKMENFNTREF